MHITNISEAKASLSSLIQQLQETHEPILIGKAGKPVAILSWYEETVAPRQLGGSWEGMVTIRDDFNEYDPEANTGFYDSTLFPDT